MSIDIDKHLARFDTDRRKEREQAVKRTAARVKSQRQRRDGADSHEKQRRESQRQGPRVGDHLLRPRVGDHLLRPPGHAVTFEHPYRTDQGSIMWRAVVDDQGVWVLAPHDTRGIVVFVHRDPPRQWTSVRVTKVSKKEVNGRESLTVFGVCVGG